MGDATRRFFEELDRREYEPLLAKAAGAIRFDLQEGPRTTHWLVVVDAGDVRVTQEDRDADTVVRTDPQLFEEIALGREDGLAAMLRGDMTISGDARLMVQMERVFPGPANSRGRHRSVDRGVA
jgi:putative sterol carrier protein